VFFFLKKITNGILQLIDDISSASSISNRNVALLFLIVVACSIMITALPLYTIQYISLDRSLMLMFGLELLVSIITYVFLLRNRQDFKNKSSVKVTIFAGFFYR